MNRQILHCDMDAFYASVEQHDRPELRGRAVIVGGSRERGVVCACSYESRPFGVRSAMPMAEALRRCPQAAVLPVRMERYRQASREVFAVFAQYTDRIEPLSIDEAFLDVTGCERLFGRAPEIARRIKEGVLAATGLTVSVGGAPNKFLAKLASEAGKPDGLVVLAPGEVDGFLLPLPIGRLWGVGAKTAERLAGLGVRTVGDLRALGRQRAEGLLGQAGGHLFRLACGEDDRPVVAPGQPKSVGHENTFRSDLVDRESMVRELLDQAERVARRVRGLGLAGRCVTLKVRFADFTTVTRSQTLPGPTDHAPLVHRQAVELLSRTEAARRPVRLLGISLSQLEEAQSGQQSLFGREQRGRQRSLDAALDTLWSRFGAGGVRRGTLLEAEGGSAAEEPAQGEPGT